MGRRIPLWQAFLCFAFTMISLMYCLGVLGNFSDVLACDYGDAHLALIASAVFATIVATLNGYKWSFLEAGIIASINRSMQAILILAEVGILIGCWVAAGVVPAMVYYGLLILKPSIFLFATCLICCIAALATGSSWTTAGTIGVALIGVATGLGIPTSMAAGAIVSGAYFGDKMSPLSDTTNLAPAMAGSNLFDHIRHMVYTVTPSLLIALVAYLILGMRADTSSSVDVVSSMREACLINFNINPWMLLPPILIIAIVALKMPAIPGIMGGIVAGMIIGSVFNGVSFADWPSILHYGYNVGTFSDAYLQAQSSLADQIASYDASSFLGMDEADFTTLASEANLSSAIIGEYNIDMLIDGRGGMESMLWTINLIMCAMCFGGVMDASGMLGELAKSLLTFAKNTGGLVTVTIVSCFLCNLVAGDQFLGIVIPGRMYKEAFEDRRLAPKNLSRCLEDSGTLTACLIPWTACGATMQRFLGVKTWGGPGGGYGPYAILNWVNPLVSIVYGFTGITMEKMTEEEYQKILEERRKEKAEALAALEA